MCDRRPPSIHGRVCRPSGAVGALSTSPARTVPARNWSVPLLTLQALCTQRPGRLREAFHCHELRPGSGAQAGRGLAGPEEWVHVEAGTDRTLRSSASPLGRPHRWCEELPLVLAPPPTAALLLRGARALVEIKGTPEASWSRGRSEQRRLSAAKHGLSSIQHLLSTDTGGWGGTSVRVMGPPGQGLLPACDPAPTSGPPSSRAATAPRAKGIRAKPLSR